MDNQPWQPLRVPRQLLIRHVYTPPMPKMAAGDTLFTSAAQKTRRQVTADVIVIKQT